MEREQSHSNKMNSIKSQKRSRADKQHWKMFSTGERFRYRERDGEERRRGRRAKRIKTTHALKSLSRTAAPTSYVDRQDALCNIQHHLRAQQMPPPYVLRVDLKCLPKSAVKHISRITDLNLRLSFWIQNSQYLKHVSD